MFEKAPKPESGAQGVLLIPILPMESNAIMCSKRFASCFSLDNSSRF